MRVKHPEPVTVECATYACTLGRDEHEPVEDPRFSHRPGDVWHHDDSTGVWWPARDERLVSSSTESSTEP